MHRRIQPGVMEGLPMEQTTQFNLNGSAVTFTGDGSRRLLWVLRTDLGLMGTKYGCGESYCGACTVVVGDEAVRSCQTAVNDVSGKNVLTIEGLSKAGKLHPIQKAFMENDALQCGYCTPGMILSGLFLLQRNPNPSEDEIRRGIEGNLCRCTGYVNIVNAIKAASAKMPKLEDSSIALR